MGRGKEDILFGFLSLDEMGREMEGILFETSCMLRFAEHSPRQSDLKKELLNGCFTLSSF
jgi:hypothetical protein